MPERLSTASAQLGRPINTCRASVWNQVLPVGNDVPMFFVQLTSHHGVALMRSPSSSGIIATDTLGLCSSSVVYSIHEGYGMTNQIDLAVLAIANGQVCLPWIAICQFNLSDLNVFLLSAVSMEYINSLFLISISIIKPQAARECFPNMRYAISKL